MAQNYISRGEVITLTAKQEYKSGNPHRISNFNGVALIDAMDGDQLSFQLEGVFEFAFPLTNTEVGEAIYIDKDDNLVHAEEDGQLFGRAVTASDKNGKFYCRILQT